MRSIKKEEIRRAFGGTGFKFAVLTGLAIAISHIVLVQIPLARENHMAQLGLLLYPLVEPYYASFYNSKPLFVPLWKGEESMLNKDTGGSLPVQCFRKGFICPCG